MKNEEKLENLAAQAAPYQRMIWQGHDEKDQALCLKGAKGLYSILTNVNTKTLMDAARYLQEAFWLSDDAEEYQSFDSELEDKMYNMAGLCLTKSRILVGLETKSVYHTIKWWKAYRHQDTESLVEHLVLEHLVQVEDRIFAEKCTTLLLDAAAEHKKKNWDAVDKKLEEYFKHYLSRTIQDKE